MLDLIQMHHFTINANVMLGKTVVTKCLFLFPSILLLLLLFFLTQCPKGPTQLKTTVKLKAHTLIIYRKFLFFKLILGSLHHMCNLE